jgi:hypothetical protein
MSRKWLIIGAIIVLAVTLRSAVFGFRSSDYNALCELSQDLTALQATQVTLDQKRKTAHTWCRSKALSL